MSQARLTAHRLRVPLPKPRSLPQSSDPGAVLPQSLSLVVVQISSDAGKGLGFAAVSGSGSAALAMIEDDFAPLLANANLLLTERLYAQARKAFPEITRGGLAACAFSAIDLALWDLKAKAAGLPLWQLLGGCRDSALVHIAETMFPGLSADQVLEIAQPLLEQKMRGLRVGVGTGDAIRDANKVQRIRDAVGEEVWFGVNGNQTFDVPTAVAFGRFLEEELDADWFEDPTAANDVDGYARLAGLLELPVAVGSTLGSESFAPLVARTGAGVLRPDIGRVGGLTAMLDVIAVADAFHRPVVAHMGPLVGIHLACAKPNVTAVEYVRWLDPVFDGGPTLREDGRLAAPMVPGLGIELKKDAVKRFEL
ncbi:MAG: mandelate racemase/muconate lactonizing enzyme family protein [Gemmataceae bacterium]